MESKEGRTIISRRRDERGLKKIDGGTSREVQGPSLVKVKGHSLNWPHSEGMWGFISTHTVHIQSALLASIHPHGSFGLILRPCYMRCIKLSGFQLNKLKNTKPATLPEGPRSWYISATVHPPHRQTRQLEWVQMSSCSTLRLTFQKWSLCWR